MLTLSSVLLCVSNIATGNETGKQAIFYQASLCEFQRQFKFGMEDKKWQYEYRSRLMGLEK